MVYQYDVGTKWPAGYRPLFIIASTTLIILVRALEWNPQRQNSLLQLKGFNSVFSTHIFYLNILSLARFMNLVFVFWCILVI